MISIMSTSDLVLSTSSDEGLEILENSTIIDRTSDHWWLVDRDGREWFVDFPSGILVH